MFLRTVKKNAIMKEDYSKRGLTKDETLLLETTETGDFITVRLDLLGQCDKKRIKIEVYNERTRVKADVYIDKSPRILEAIGLL